MSTDTAVASQASQENEFQTGRVATISATHAVHDTYTAFLAPLLPAFKESLALSNTQAGLLTVFNQAPSVLQPLIGHLADRLTLRFVVILTPAVTATGMSLLGVAPSYLVLALLLTVVGLSSATLHSVAPVIAGRLSGRNLGRGMGFWMVGGELGRTLGPLIIVGAVEFLGLGGTTWLMIGGWLTSILLYFVLGDVSARPVAEARGLPWKQALRAMGPLLVPLVGIIVVRSFMAASLTTYLPIFLTTEGAELWFAGVSLSILEGAGVVGALLGGSLSDRLGRRTMLTVSLVSTPALMLLFVVVAGWVRLPLLLALGLTSLSVTPVIMALVQESSPQNRALANGTYMMLSFLIRSGVVVVVGALGDTWGMRTAFIASAIIPLLGLPFLRMLPSRRETSIRHKQP